MFIRGVFEIILVASIVNISHSQLNTIQETGTMNLQMGQNFIELGGWRFGMHDYYHFVFSHKSGYTSVIYRGYEQAVHPGPRRDFSLWNLSKGRTNIKFGNNFIQFGSSWRLAEIDSSHLSLGHVSWKTCMIWRVDGTKHPGPRTDFNGFQSQNTKRSSKISFGQNFIEIGYWRIGQVDDIHLSIGTITLTAQIYRSDGTIHDGPRIFDFRIQKQTIGRLN